MPAYPKTKPIIVQKWHAQVADSGESKSRDSRSESRDCASHNGFFRRTGRHTKGAGSGQNLTDWPQARAQSDLAGQGDPGKRDAVVLPRATEGLGLEVRPARKDVIGCCFVNIRMRVWNQGLLSLQQPDCSPGCRDFKSRMGSRRIVVLWLKIHGR